MRHISWKHFGVVLFTGLLLLAGAWGLFSWLPMDAMSYLTVPRSGEIHDRRGVLLHPFLNSAEQWCFERNLSQISPYLIHATLAIEDHRFYDHWGIDPIAIVRAAWQNLRSGRVVSGASTITMQVVKPRLTSERGFWKKVLQAVQAVRLERHVDKATILQTYLNTAPYGLNLVGCEAAARRYFGKTARELTLPESALLAGLPKAPSSYMPLAHPERAKLRRDYVLQRMREEGYIDEEEYRAAIATPLDVRRHEFPGYARHVAARLKPFVAGGKTMQTTLDADVQALAERMLQETIRGYAGKIGNAAAIVVDAESAEILAWVGSADFFQTPGGGQVDVVRAPRSPGSTLKPFLYAAAMERNVLYSSEMLLDNTLDYGLYAPENADGKYRGLVSASEALRRSLNVPAVLVLERLGVDTVYTFLRDMGFRSLKRSADFYGLGFALGDCEVTLEELATAYTMVANLGEWRPLRLIATVRAPTPQRKLSRGVCLQLYQMLEQTLPEELDSSAVPAGGSTSRVCWKTGTSTGQRDAWTVIFNRHYVVGVWMGNNDGKPSTWLVGARAALPLAGRLFRALPAKTDAAWPEVGDDLVSVEVCATSGLPASAWCEHKRQVSLPRSQFLHRVCDVHYPVQGTDNLMHTMERFPGIAKGWDLANVQSPMTPNESPSSSTVKRVSGARILVPADRAEFVLTGEKQGDRIRLESSADGETPVHWYVDDRYVGTSTATAPVFLALEEGEHRLTCMSGRGEVDAVEFRVVPPKGTLRFKP